jgi:predicted nucleic acid-binding Zn ribbon protein
MYLGPDSDAFGELVLRLFPVARCRFKGCREPYLRYSERARHCSETCRRAQADGPPVSGITRLAACAVCGGALVGRQMRYCNDRCRRRAEYTAKRARTRPTRAGTATKEGKGETT